MIHYEKLSKEKRLVVERGSCIYTHGEAAETKGYSAGYGLGAITAKNTKVEFIKIL
jgi:hypothetical protein